MTVTRGRPPTRRVLTPGASISLARSRRIVTSRLRPPKLNQLRNHPAERIFSGERKSARTTNWWRPARSRRARLERQVRARVPGDRVPIEPHARAVIDGLEADGVVARLGDGEARAIPGDRPAVARERREVAGVGRVRHAHRAAREAAVSGAATTDVHHPRAVERAPPGRPAERHRRTARARRRRGRRGSRSGVPRRVGGRRPPQRGAQHDGHDDRCARASHAPMMIPRERTARHSPREGLSNAEQPPGGGAIAPELVHRCGSARIAPSP